MKKVFVFFFFENFKSTENMLYITWKENPDNFLQKKQEEKTTQKERILQFDCDN